MFKLSKRGWHVSLMWLKRKALTATANKIQLRRNTTALECIYLEGKRKKGDIN